MTFSQKTLAGFLAILALALAITGVAVMALRSVKATQDEVLFTDAHALTKAEELRYEEERKVVAARGYLLTVDDHFLEQKKTADVRFGQLLQSLVSASRTSVGRSLLDVVAKADRAHEDALRVLITDRHQGQPEDAAARAFDVVVMPRRVVLDDALHAFVAHKQQRLEQGVERLALASSRARLLTLGIAAGGVMIAILLAVMLTRTLSGLYRQSQEAVRARDDFLASASHEIRAPLSAMRLQCDLLLGKVGSCELSPERVTGGLALMDRQLRRMIRMIGDLLDTSRITAGRLLLERCEVDLASVTREVSDGMRDELDRAHCPLILRANGPVVGWWDASRVDQIITNLLTNAMKYGEGKPIEVTVDGTPFEGRVVVRDSGVGIPPAEQASIFERFERAATGRGFTGTGLGLWIARQIVEAHRGKIGVESFVGLGSTFTVLLPRRPPPEAPAGDGHGGEGY